jgi:hypothetical protein
MENKKTPAELIHGKEIAEKEEEFNEALHQIELTHLEFFKTQQPHDEREKHARLHDYYFVFTSDGRITLSFLPERELRNDIKQSVINAFTNTYPR